MGAFSLQIVEKDKKSLQGTLSAGHASDKEEKNDLFIFTYGCFVGAFLSVKKGSID